MESLLPGIREQYLPVERARSALVDHPGLVPVAIHPGDEEYPSRRIYLADISDTPFLEWKYIYTIQRLAEEGKITRHFSTDLELLDAELPTDDGMDPDGLMFHVSRCGSTLFCKALAQLPSNLIINQGGPVQSGFWAALTDHWRRKLEPSDQNVARLRRLVRLMTRRRRPEYARCFMKFISWNTIYADFVRAAFPESPALYLYRDPGEVIAIVLQETTAALHARGTRLADVITGLPGEETSKMGDVAFLAHCYANYFKLVAERADVLRISPVNYRQLRQRDLFADVLDRGLDWRPEQTELEQMRAQFDYDSKDDSNRTRYQGEPDLEQALGSEGRQLVDAVAGEWARALDCLPRNLFRERQD
jgi:hypothetical protein